MDLVLAPPAGAPPSEPAFTAYAEALDVNWSDELEALHQESSRDHFLDVLTRAALADAIAGAVPPGGAILDVGCSTGYLLEDLARLHPDARLLGLDLVAAGLRRAHENVPQAQLLLADVCAIPVRDGGCDAVVSANLLEHVPDDAAALAEIRRVLRPGGRAALVVPAGAGTYDYYDRFLSHERRYARGELAGKARSVGLEVRRDTHIGSLIYPAFWAVKKLNRRRHPNPSEAEIRTLVERDIARTRGSRIGAVTARIERAALSRGASLPAGIRNLVVVERG
jgi:SAM-dependent methyltransferase